MKYILAALMSLCLISPVLADKPTSYQATGPDFKVTIYPKLPCTAVKVQAILSKNDATFSIKDMFKASIVYQGKKIAGCAKNDSGLVLVIGEDGNGSVLPLDMFAELTGV